MLDLKKSTNSSNDLFTYILSNNLLRSLPHQKLKTKLHIAKLNSEIDLYTNQKISDVRSSSYQVDHIFELQCFSHVISMALSKLDCDYAAFNVLRDRLVKIINSDFNLNVTDKQANLVKMNVFKEFIKRRREDSIHPSLIRFFRNSPNFNKNISLFCCTLRNACKLIRQQLVIYMNESSKILSNVIKRIIDEFDIFYNSLQIEDYDLIRFH